MLPTLVSRSQVYTLGPLEASCLEKLWQASSSGKACYGQRRNLGRPAAQADPDFWQQRKALGQELKGVLTARREPLLTAENWQSLADRFLDLAEIWLRDILMLQTVREYTPINSDMLEELADCVSACPREKTVVLLKECAAARERLRARCNPRLVFDGLLLKMWEV